MLSILQPKSNLHILAEDDDVFWDLPLSVQQQVWSCALVTGSSCPASCRCHVQPPCVAPCDRHPCALGVMPVICRDLRAVCEFRAEVASWRIHHVSQAPRRNTWAVQATARCWLVQVWDISVARLHKHCLPLLNSWCMEVDMLRTQVDMLYFVPGATSQGLLKSATPSDVRQRSPVISR